jgi:metal-responsive CopG/Arc/MetJ family transcriptional regulator
MSSKKIYTSVGIDAEVFDRLKEDAARERRSRSSQVSKILREYYREADADQTKAG